MIRGEPLTVVIPVRSGSKGIPGKNLHELEGKTLLERTIEFAGAAPRVDEIYVTTDDPVMYAITESYDPRMAVNRPVELASDEARTIDVVLQLVEAVGVERGFVLLLQVISPLRTMADLNRLCTRFERQKEAEAIASVNRHEEPHPDKCLRVVDGYLSSYLGTDPNVPRQTLPSVYALNGAFYLAGISTLQKKRTFLPSKTLPYEMPPERSINLDTPLDLILLEAVLERGLVTLEDHEPNFGSSTGSS